MCLYTKCKKPKKAEKNIIVYKVLYKNGTSPYRGFCYNLKNTYETNMRIVKSLFSNGLYVHEGFHAFLSKKISRKSDLFKYRTGTKIFKCIIPKYGEYYISSDNTKIVSDSIIIKRRLLFNRF